MKVSIAVCYRLLAIAILFHLFSAQAALAAAPKDVSIIQLIANPERFDGQSIRIVGFLRLEYEGNAVYFHRDDFDRRIFQNAIYLGLTDEQLRASHKLSNDYVLVEGIFNATEKGHFGSWPGSVQQISKITRWPKCGPPTRYKQCS